MSMSNFTSFGGWFAVSLLVGACSADAEHARRAQSVPSPVSAGIGNGGIAGTTSTASAGTTALLPPPSVQPSNVPMVSSIPTTSTRMPVTIDQCGSDNPAMLNDQQRMKLLTGNGAPGALRWLYPYEGTVFPRGMVAPMLMWEGGPADAIYLHIKSQFFEYKGCLKPSGDGQLTLPQDIWERAGAQSFGKMDPFNIELRVLQNGAVVGPIVRKIIIALANIKGSIYYNSYNSLIGAGLGGTVLRIPQGKTAEPFLNSGCNGCHAVSANGARMISQFAPASFGQSYQLDMNTTANPPGTTVGPRAAWGALYPDGSHYLATSIQVTLASTRMTQAFGAPEEATLYNASTGAIVQNTGIPAGALMPTFSPDGTLLVFNDNAIEAAHGLALMKYNVATHAASAPRTLMKTSGALRPGWPFVLPDNRAVVFTQTDGADFSGNGAGLFGAGLGIAGPSSDLYIVDVETGTVTMLARAMGFDSPDAISRNETYLPFGVEELHQNYFPTVSAVAAGGYFWVFFDSVRRYGSLGPQRALWASAVEIRSDGSYLQDPSQPAFYLPGQEFNTGNHRAFAALDPCKPDGGTCLSGIDCCGGRCILPEANEFEQPPGTCSPPPKNECAKTDERCTTESDCCPPNPGRPANSCIAGFCAFVMLN